MHLLPFLLFLILWFASANGNCVVEFKVNNCTEECPEFDHTRGNIKIAACVYDNTSNTSTCSCANFPRESLSPIMQYYPQVGHTSRCVNAFETAPALYTVMAVVSNGIILYAAAHLLYLVAQSGMFSCTDRSCSKVDVAALLYAGYQLIYFVRNILVQLAEHRLVGNNSADDYLRLGHSVEVLYVCAAALGMLCLGLFYTSIVDTIYAGENKVVPRYVISTIFWILAIAGTLGFIFQIPRAFMSDEDLKDMWAGTYGIANGIAALMTIFSLVFMIIAHVTIARVSLYSTWRA